MPSQTRASNTPARVRLPGNVMVYSVFVMTALLGLASVAVDFGRVQTIKSDLQRCADATALAAMNAYADSGYSVPAATAVGLAIIAANPVDQGSGVKPTLTYYQGNWNAVSRTFGSTASAGTPAVMIVMSRTAAKNNAVPLTFGKAIGMSDGDGYRDARRDAVGADQGPVDLEPLPRRHAERGEHSVGR